MSTGKQQLVFQEQNDGSFRISADTELKLGVSGICQEVKPVGNNLECYVRLQNELSIYKRKNIQCLKQMPLVINKSPVNLREYLIKEFGKECMGEGGSTCTPRPGSSIGPDPQDFPPKKRQCRNFFPGL